MHPAPCNPNPNIAVRNHTPTKECEEWILRIQSVRYGLDDLLHTKVPSKHAHLHTQVPCEHVAVPVPHMMVLNRTLCVLCLPFCAFYEPFPPLPSINRILHQQDPPLYTLCLVTPVGSQGGIPAATLLAQVDDGYRALAVRLGLGLGLLGLGGAHAAVLRCGTRVLRRGA